MQHPSNNSRLADAEKSARIDTVGSDESKQSEEPEIDISQVSKLMIKLIFIL